MKSRFAKSILILGLLFAFGACSSSQTKEEGATDAAAPSADAGTDAVPLPNPEALASPTPDATADAAKAQATPPVAPVPVPAAQESTTSVASSGSGESESYTVQRGDTLMKVAFEAYGDIYKWKSIYESNKDKISDPNKLSAGTVLTVEKAASPVTIERNGEKYLIKPGDTLGKISSVVYGTPSKWKKLWENNKQLIHDPNRIFAGFYLYYIAEEGTHLGASGASPTGDSQATASAPTPAPATDLVSAAKAVGDAAGTGAPAVPSIGK